MTERSRNNLDWTATIAKVGAAVVFGAIALHSDQVVLAKDSEKGHRITSEKPEIFTPDLTPTATPDPIYQIPTVETSLTPTLENTETNFISVEGTPEELKNYNGYRVVGSKIYNPYGEEIIFRGVSRPSFEWSKEGDNTKTPEESGYPQMKEWGFNTVRLPMNQVFWLTDPEYKKAIDQQVKWANESGLNVILDLHWSGKGELKDAGQQQMPDMHSLEFWKEVATIYKDNPSVLFELYNEPHDISSEIWAHGGIVSDGFETPGMQKMIDVIRETGALNITIANGNNWGFDHRGLPPLEGANKVKGAHPYGMYSEKDSPADFDIAFGYLLDQGEAVIITEFGDTTSCDTEFYETVWTFSRNKEISRIPWAWWPDYNAADPSKSCKFPGIIADWSGNPLPGREDIYNALQTPEPDGSVLNK